MSSHINIKKFIPECIKDVFKVLYAYSVPPTELIKWKKNIKSYKNKYLGKRCFIIGNGPSLKVADLDKLCNEYTFASNRIYYMFAKTKWRPTFYCVQDILVAKEISENIVTASFEAETTFIRMKAYSSINESLKKINNLILIPLIPTNSDKKINFSDKADKYLSDGWNVTYMSLQLAAYMGFSEIYLLGVDFSYPIQKDNSGNIISVDNTISAHFYKTEDDKNKRNVELFRDKTLSYYKAAEIYSKKSGKFRIFNATRGGKLEVFERIDFDKLF